LLCSCITLQFLSANFISIITSVGFALLVKIVMYFVYKNDDQTLRSLSNSLRSRLDSRKESRSVEYDSTYPPDHDIRPSESGFGNDFAPRTSGDGNVIFHRHAGSGNMFGRTVLTNPATPRERDRRLKEEDSSFDRLDNDMPFGMATDEIYVSRRKSGHRDSYVEQMNPAFQKKHDVL